MGQLPETQNLNWRSQTLQSPYHEDVPASDTCCGLLHDTEARLAMVIVAALAAAWGLCLFCYSLLQLGRQKE